MSECSQSTQSAIIVPGLDKSTKSGHFQSLMTVSEVRHLLDRVREGTLDPSSASEQIVAAMRAAPYEDLGFARVDHHRELRQGFPEVILGVGKTPAQIAAIADRIVSRGHALLITRAQREAWDAVRAVVPNAEHHEAARAITLRQGEIPPGRGTILLAAAGTSDLPVAREAMHTARYLGRRTELIVDVGVAGLHRLLARLDALRRARVVVVAAGMDGALPSVVAGLVAAPVVAVPTSVGYGAAFGGLAPLLAMLNACAPGVAVVNIDNGYGAGHLAAQIAAP